jgi:p70 ribosomal S6 kinase
VFTQQKLSLNDFEKVSMLGEGGFAVVYQVRRKRPLTESRANETFAMKVISKKQLYERCVLDGLMFERMMMIKLDCRFAVKLFCSFQDKHSCYFVMEYAKGGDVYSFLINRKQNLKVEEYIKTGESGARMVMGCVVLAFERLQKENIVYRDLKPENVLIFENGYAKLADFGLAKIYKPG